jgi:hypothetical protein
MQSLMPRPSTNPPTRPESSGKERLPEAGRLHGAGLGFWRELIEPLKAGVPEAISFFELAPENWVAWAAAQVRICAT